MDKLKKELEILRSWGIESIPVDKVLSMIDEVEEEEDEIIVEDHVDAPFKGIASEGIASSIVTASPVGGKIFYIDDTSDGVYEFFDVNGNPIKNVQVGDRPYYYRVIKKGSKDKYYVYRDKVYNNLEWTYCRDKGYVHESLGTSNDIGSGKTNTEKVMAKDNGVYITVNSNGRPTIWHQLQQIRNAKAGGCDDWFIPSLYEVEKLRKAIKSGIITGGAIAGSSYSDSVFNSKWLWSSSELSDQSAWLWNYSFQIWPYGNKPTNASVFFVRAF